MYMLSTLQMTNDKIEEKKIQNDPLKKQNQH